MSAAAKLKVIEGGLADATTAPVLPATSEADRLYPVFKGGGAAFTHVVAVSLVLHGAILIGTMNWNIFGEERADGGSEAWLVIEGVDVVMLDQMPSVAAPLAEARAITDVDIAPPIEDTRMAAVEPLPPVAADATTSPATGTEAKAAASPPSGDALPVDSEPATAVAATAAFEIDVARTIESDTEAAAEPIRPDTRVGPAASMPVEAEAADATVASADTPAESDRDARRPVAATAALQPANESRVADAPPDEAVKPANDIATKAAVEILAEPPASKPVAAEAARPVPEAKSESKPNKKPAKAASLPNPSTPASEANPAARGPTKGKAGAGGKNPKAQGSASVLTYQSRLVAHLRRFRTYPDAARSKRLQGTAVVNFTIDGGGRVVGASLAKGTGHAILDKAALAMVRRASPFPAMPAGIGKSRMTVRAPIRFDMR